MTFTITLVQLIFLIVGLLEVIALGAVLVYVLKEKSQDSIMTAIIVGPSLILAELLTLAIYGGIYWW